MLCFSEFIEKYVVSGGTQTRIFPPNPIPKVELDSLKVELDSFFFFIQTGPNTPLYANLSLSPYIFSPPCFRFFSRTSGGGIKKETGTAAVYTYIRNIQKKYAEMIKK